MIETHFDILALVVAGVVLVGLALWFGERTLGSSRQGSSGTADVFGNLIDVFHPAQARALRDLRQHDDAGPVIPSPEDDDEREVRLVTDAEGNPVAARIRRPPRSAVEGDGPQ